MRWETRFETLQLHVGQEQPDPATDSRAVPIYQTTSYVFKNSAHAAARFGLADAGNIYGRLTNSTQDVFEKRIAALEGGVAALATASGSAAIAYAIQNIAKAGDHIVSSTNLYGGTTNLFENTLPEQGITATLVDPSDPENFEKAIQPNTKLLYSETLGNPNSDVVDLEAIALATAGCVGSDLANMINEAAINAVKNGRQYVTQADLFESVEVVIAGKEKKDRIMGPKEKRLVAYHEVGHALVTALQKDAEPVQKITIVPRTMGSLGYTLQMPEEEKYLETKAELEARLVTYMGGRAAEEIMCDSVTTGASNDIEMATRIARAMVTQFGMSDEFGLMGVESVENRYLDGRAVTNCGDETIAKVDEVVKVMLQKAYDTAKEMLLSHRDVLERIAGYLYEHETIMDIFKEMTEGNQPIDVEAEEVTAQTDTQSAPIKENETEFSGNEPVAPDEAFEE